LNPEDGGKGAGCRTEEGIRGSLWPAPFITLGRGLKVLPKVEASFLSRPIPSLQEQPRDAEYDMKSKPILKPLPQYKDIPDSKTPMYLRL
jgi:hypothetical protein